MRRGRYQWKLNEYESALLNFVEAHPTLSYHRLASEFLARTGIKVSSTALNSLAVRHGVRSGSLKPLRRPKGLAERVKRLGPKERKTVSEFIKNARMSREERGLVESALIDEISLGQLRERFGFGDVGLRLYKICNRIGLHELIGRLESSTRG